MIEQIMPTDFERWPRARRLWIGAENEYDDVDAAEVKAYVNDKMWTWDGARVYFFCDLHADADAFFRSLIAGGGVIKTGPGDTDFELTEEGREAIFMIGGDCFDKGPNNLRLLEVIHHLYEKGGRVELLAGNHDIRTYLGIYSAESKDPLLDHLFVRMGKKTVPLLKEIFETIEQPKTAKLSKAEIEDIKARFFPSEFWYEQFPRVAKDWIKEEKLEKEIRRIKEKTIEFEQRMESAGLGLAEMVQAVEKFRQLFFHKDGRYHWFFENMKLAHREGAYLYVHAGVDDSVSWILAEKGVAYLNQEFRRLLSDNPFELYHGKIGNVFRTKYRGIDFELTEAGVKALHGNGIYAIVHGHRNILQGQRVIMRKGMLNFECDASVDANTRIVEGLSGPGGAVVVFDKDGKVNALSTDYPYIKQFHPNFLTVAPQFGRVNVS